MKLEDLDFPLPEDRVATPPPPRREDARLLMAQPGGGDGADPTLERGHALFC